MTAPKAKRFCKTCGVMRPVELFLHPATKGKLGYVCLLHTRSADVPAALRDLVAAERRLWLDSKSPKSALRARRRARKAAKRESRDAYLPVVHERQLRRKKAASVRVAFRPPQMTRSEYADYLQSPHWLSFGEAFRTNPDVLHECYVCGHPQYELHHRSYARVGRERLEDVVPLCPEHHRATHRLIKGGLALDNAHTYVKSRYQRGELDLKVVRDRGGKVDTQG